VNKLDLTGMLSADAAERWKLNGQKINNRVFTGGRDSSLTSMLCVTLDDGRARNVRGSISSPKSMRQEVRHLRALIADFTKSDDR